MWQYLEVGRTLDICQDQRVLNKTIIKVTIESEGFVALFTMQIAQCLWKEITDKENTHNVHGPFIAVELKNALALWSCPYCGIVIVIILLVSLVRYNLQIWQIFVRWSGEQTHKKKKRPSLCSLNTKQTRKMNSSYRVLRLGLHAREGRVGCEEMRKHPLRRWENLK